MGRKSVSGIPGLSKLFVFLSLLVLSRRFMADDTSLFAVEWEI
jgi:hypothetical protein